MPSDTSDESKFSRRVLPLLGRMPWVTATQTFHEFGQFSLSMAARTAGRLMRRHVVQSRPVGDNLHLHLRSAYQPHTTYQVVWAVLLCPNGTWSYLRKLLSQQAVPRRKRPYAKCLHMPVHSLPSRLTDLASRVDSPTPEHHSNSSCPASDASLVFPADDAAGCVAAVACSNLPNIATVRSH